MYEKDEVLYARFLKEKNNEDLKELLARHRESLTLFLYGILHNMEDAEDLMLDAFALAASGTSKFKGESSFKTWLFSIGHHKAMKQLRKRRFSFITRDEAGNMPDMGHLPEAEILSDERRRHLYLALGKVKEDYRQVLYLLYFEDMSIEEAASVMGRNAKQIYNLSYRAKEALRKQLEGMGFTYEDT